MAILDDCQQNKKVTCEHLVEYSRAECNATHTNGGSSRIHVPFALVQCIREYSAYSSSVNEDLPACKVSRFPYFTIANDVLRWEDYCTSSFLIVCIIFQWPPECMLFSAPHLTEIRTCPLSTSKLVDIHPWHWDNACHMSQVVRFPSLSKMAIHEKIPRIT